MLAGRYRLDTRIGAGGMGEVWRGEDIVLARTVAVKVLLPGRMDDPGFLARFQGEARAMATVNHSGVVDVYDYGVSGDTVYLVMKFVDGESLDRLLGRLGRIAPEPAMELIAQAASALQAVHDQGIVHRDVKPGNLLVQRDGTLVITDFGIARSDLANRLTDAGMVLGTAAYCAPEQAEGAPVTPAVDIYALGVVAYECLVGQRPFDGDSAVTIALKHIREAPPPLPADIPPAVRALVEKALSKDPARRFASSGEMAAVARQAAQGRQAMPELAAAPVPAALPESPATAEPAQQQNDTTPVVPNRRRKVAKARSRGGLVAALAVATVLGAGAGAIAITNMGLPSEGPGPSQPQAGEDPITAGVTTEPSTPTPTKSPRPRPKPTASTEPPVRSTEPEDEPDDKLPSLDPEPTTTTERPSPTPSRTKDKTSASATPGLKKVPNVVDMLYPEARQVIAGAGFTVRYYDDSNGSVPHRCLNVISTTPKAGTMLAPRKSVTLNLVGSLTCAAEPTPTPTPTPDPSAGGTKPAG
ncbi:hypothetical protein GCM10009560_18860 [Nonomuraea longicatena]|uniref:non-specific serine/threonine protein kinase n=2 Tax=Nonomuraea longicatena TaxID=83682 RepID=A0ABP3ZES2_9ACTN